MEKLALLFPFLWALFPFLSLPGEGVHELEGLHLEGKLVDGDKPGWDLRRSLLILQADPGERGEHGTAHSLPGTFPYPGTPLLGVWGFLKRQSCHSFGRSLWLVADGPEASGGRQDVGRSPA